MKNEESCGCAFSFFFINLQKPNIYAYETNGVLIPTFNITDNLIIGYL